MRIRARICLLLLFGALLLAPMQSGGAAPAQEGQPLDLGLQEKAGVTLLMLDVKVRDKDGQPVRGLT
ncbi:MAG: hypothetical protein O7F11_07450, partial [Acidobacteria bacterium]|nr:hypothetical protein [Acidobacteriota bacterium]